MLKEMYMPKYVDEENIHQIKLYKETLIKK